MVSLVQWLMRRLVAFITMAIRAQLAGERVKIRFIYSVLEVIYPLTINIQQCLQTKAQVQNAVLADLITRLIKTIKERERVQF